jgi:hypothetical protein
MYGKDGRYSSWLGISCTTALFCLICVNIYILKIMMMMEADIDASIIADNRERETQLYSQEGKQHKATCTPFPPRYSDGAQHL